MSKFQDLSGEKIGHLTILYRGQDYIQPSGQHKIVCIVFVIVEMSAM